MGRLNRRRGTQWANISVPFLTVWLKLTRKHVARDHHVYTTIADDKNKKTEIQVKEKSKINFETHHSLTREFTTRYGSGICDL